MNSKTNAIACKATDAGITIQIAVVNLVIAAEKHGSLENVTLITPLRNTVVEKIPTVGDIIAIDYPPVFSVHGNEKWKTTRMCVVGVHEVNMFGITASVMIKECDGDSPPVDGKGTADIVSPFNANETVDAFRKFGWCAAKVDARKGELLDAAKEKLSQRWDAEFADLLDETIS